MSKNELQCYIERLMKLPREPFKPHAYYEPIDDSIQIYLSPDSYYAECTENRSIDVYRDMETKEVVGVHIFGIRRIRESMLTRANRSMLIDQQLAELEGKE